MVTVVVDGERAIQQDDGRLIMASQDLSARLAHVTSQEQQLANLASLVPDPAIPITFTKVIITHCLFSWILIFVFIIIFLHMSFTVSMRLDFFFFFFLLL